MRFDRDDQGIRGDARGERLRGGREFKARHVRDRARLRRLTPRHPDAPPVILTTSRHPDESQDPEPHSGSIVALDLGSSPG
ncbi:hypothetical protein SPHINGO391_490184 [Sphingomonas aurantiaca]|uniref:Uncharacterized protein n=1 Tax=Sphingomonas aurantiaca TaxID=185949 RepID=A0A5E8A6K8_9SPHN|nr:hypothetical protein SPHINGO391_490184 [Sphingomonas aurantiaca]